MPEAVVKAVGKLSKSFGQVLAFPTVSTAHVFRSSGAWFLPSRRSTSIAQFFDGFTHVIYANFYLLIQNLCPVSTVPTNNTNLIKEL